MYQAREKEQILQILKQTGRIGYTKVGAGNVADAESEENSRQEHFSKAGIDLRDNNLKLYVLLEFGFVSDVLLSCINSVTV